MKRLSVVIGVVAIGLIAARLHRVSSQEPGLVPKANIMRLKLEPAKQIMEGMRWPTFKWFAGTASSCVN